MNILAFGASNSRHSINKTLASYALDLFKESYDAPLSTEVLDLNDYTMPMYSEDEEKASGIPLKATTFLEKIKACDGMIISFAEHNGTYTVAYNTKSHK